MSHRSMNTAEKLMRLVSNQSELSRHTGIAQTEISKIIRGDRRLYLDVAFKLAKAIGVPLDYLADEEMIEIPRLELNAGEREVLNIVRDIGIQEARKRLLKAPEIESTQKPPEKFRGVSTSPFPLIDPDLSSDNKPTARPVPGTPRRVK